MKLLAIDCSTHACSVALLNNSDTEDHDMLERYDLASRSHTEKLLPMVEEVLAESQCSLKQLDAIAFGCGPGSFTGLRICLGAVQGLAYGADLPVAPISSLAALAQTALNFLLTSDSTRDLQPGNHILSTIDARMDEIYWGVYEFLEDGISLSGQEQLTSPELFTLPTDVGKSDVWAVGTGFEYQDRIACNEQVELIDSQMLPRASAVAQLAHKEVINNRLYSPEQALPTYLRDQVAWKKQQ